VSCAPAVTWALALELPVRLLVGLRLLECGDLRLGQHAAVLGDLRLQRLQAMPHRRQIVPLPDAAPPPADTMIPRSASSLATRNLTPGRLLDREHDHRRLHLRRHAVL
jgi:hypothetical protein